MARYWRSSNKTTNESLLSAKNMRVVSNISSNPVRWKIPPSLQPQKISSMDGNQIPNELILSSNYMMFCFEKRLLAKVGKFIGHFREWNSPIQWFISPQWNKEIVTFGSWAELFGLMFIHIKFILKAYCQFIIIPDNKRNAQFDQPHTYGIRFGVLIMGENLFLLWIVFFSYIFLFLRP